MTPEDILSTHCETVRRIADQLRRLVLATVPEMTERGYPGWHGIGFRHPSAGYLCRIFPAAESVKLLFEQGVLLPDPHNLWQGEGKQTRYIEITNEASIPVNEIVLLLLEAVALKARLKS